MGYNIEWTERARDDIMGITLYISIELQQPVAAKNLSHNIGNYVDLLSENPLMYKEFESEPWHSKGWRYFPVNNYLIFYEVVEEINTVRVLRIVYGARNIEHLL